MSGTALEPEGFRIPLSTGSSIVGLPCLGTPCPVELSERREAQVEAGAHATISSRVDLADSILCITLITPGQPFRLLAKAEVQMMRSTTVRQGTLLLAAVSTAVSLCVLSSGALAQCISYTTFGSANNQDFNTLALSGTSSTTPAGWAFSESGTNANTTYTAGTGSSNAGDTYSFGAAASSERAFGGLFSSNLTPTIGACFTNNTGGLTIKLTISYTG